MSPRERHQMIFGLFWVAVIVVGVAVGLWARSGLVGAGAGMAAGLLTLFVGDKYLT